MLTVITTLSELAFYVFGAIVLGLVGALIVGGLAIVICSIIHHREFE